MPVRPVCRRDELVGALMASEPPPVPETHPSDHVEKHVLRRLELAQRLGRGAYGVVWKVIEKRSRAILALKKCFDAFRNATDAQRTYREVCVCACARARASAAAAARAGERSGKRRPWRRRARAVAAWRRWWRPPR